MPSSFSHWLFGLVMAMLLVAFLLPAIMHILARIRKREPARMPLSLRNRCLSVLLAYLMIVGPAGFEQIAHASTLYSELGTGSWGEAGKVFSYCYDDNGSKTHKFYGDVDVVNNSPEDIITNNPTIAYDHHIYNLQNRLARLEKYDQTHTLTDVIEYIYNTDGIRVQKIDDPDGAAITTTYLVDAYNHTGYAQVLEESGANLKTYTIGDDILTQATDSGAGRHLLYDGHGSTRQLVTGSVGSTSIVDDFSYDGYGVLLQNEDNFPPNGTQDPGKVAQQATSLLYAGEHFDTDSQNYYLRARWYDSLSGRFNRMDPFAGNNQDPQSLHKYLYAHCNPVMNIDPSGMFLGLMMAGINRLTFMVMNLAVRCLPAILFVTKVAFAMMIVSGIQLVLEQAGFVAETGYTEEIFAISLMVFTLGLSLAVFIESFRGIVEPVRNTKGGQVISGNTANQRSPATNPPYKPKSLAVEGRGAPGTDVVRMYSDGVTNRESGWATVRSEVTGLTPADIQNKLALRYTPTHYTEVNAAEAMQRVGIAGRNFLQDGGGIQIEFLEKVSFSEGIPIPAGGL